MYYPLNTDNDAILWKLEHGLEKIVKDSALQRTVVQYKTKLAVFSDWRRALGAAPEPASNGLTQITVTTSRQELQKIKTAVKALMQALDRQIQNATEPVLHKTHFCR